MFSGIAAPPRGVLVGGRVCALRAMGANPASGQRREATAMETMAARQDPCLVAALLPAAPQELRADGALRNFVAAVSTGNTLLIRHIGRWATLSTRGRIAAGTAVHSCNIVAGAGDVVHSICSERWRAVRAFPFRRRGMVSTRPSATRVQIEPCAPPQYERAHFAVALLPVPALAPGAAVRDGTAARAHAAAVGATRSAHANLPGAKPKHGARDEDQRFVLRGALKGQHSDRRS